MLNKLKEIEANAAAAIAAMKDGTALEAARVKYLGKKGELTAILRGMGSLSADERPVIGAAANVIRQNIEAAIEKKEAELKEQFMNTRLASEKIDVTLPAKEKHIGVLHPLRQTENQMREIFIGMGFDIVEGPEVESTHNNFDALNAPADHPSRDETDTFYLSDDVVLRTQTSPVQIRAMQTRRPPIRIISPGRVYRCDPADATHSPMFHQLEGLVIDKHITLCDLKGTLDQFARSMFGEGTKTRFPTTSLSQNLRLKSTSHASYAAARAVVSAKVRDGSKCWVRAWCIPTCLPAVISTRMYTADSRSA